MTLQDYTTEELKTELKRRCDLAEVEEAKKKEYALKFTDYIQKQAKAYDFNLPHRGYDIYAFAKDLLAWVEKQGEQKPAEDFNKKELIKIEDEPENYKQQVMAEINDVVEEYIDWLRSLKNKIDDKLVIQEAKKYYSDNINAFDAFLHGVEFAEGILAQKR